jgi:Zn-dependent protease with chaperone function
MYGQLLYFIVALLLFSIQQPGAKPFLPAPETFALVAGLFALYLMTCLFFIRRLRRALLLQELPQSVLTLRYHRIQTYLSILAIGMLVVHIYIFNIKFHLNRIPGFEESLTLSGVAGLFLLLLHQAVIWFLSHPIYQRIHRSSIGRAAYIKGHLAFSSAILIPWLLASLLFDLFQVFKMPVFVQSDGGQFLVLGLVLIFFLFFAPPLVVRLWGCRPLPESPTRAELEGFIAQQRFTIGSFVLWPLFGGEMLTAGIMGILPRLRYILITRGLLAVLDVEELKAVVAHEMGHVRLLHMPFFLLFFISYSLLTYSLNDVILLFLLKHDVLLGWALARDNLHLTLFSLTYFIPILIMLILYFRYIFGFFLRNSERQADLYALKLIGHPFTLISSLQKIALYSGHIEDLPSWHHYSIRQRVHFLLDAYDNPSMVGRHHWKLYGAAAAFLTIVIGLGIAGFELKDTKYLKGWRTEVEVSLMERAIRQEPDNAKHYAQFGGLLFEIGRYKQAESTLRRALDLSPGDATVLNNLAWLYAIAPPPHFNPGAALELALQAAALDPNPQHLDTLAEAYYVNGRFREAIDTIQKALTGKPDDPAYFLRQKEKFEEALRNQEAGRRSVLLHGRRVPSPSGRGLG